MTSIPKNRRFTAAEAREAVLDSGIELIEKYGLDSGLGRIKLDEAIREARVPRGSAHRAFNYSESQAQETFRRDLLARLIRRGTVTEQMTTSDATVESLASQRELLDSSDPRLLGIALRETIRRGTEANLIAIGESAEWHVYISSLAVAHFATNPDPVIIEAHEVGEALANKEYVDLYKAIGAVFGLRLRDGMSWQYFAMLAAGAAQGAALRWKSSLLPSEFTRPTGPNRELRKWSSFGIVFEGLLLACAEPDPDSDVISADLSSWSQASTQSKP